MYKQFFVRLNICILKRRSQITRREWQKQYNCSHNNKNKNKILPINYLLIVAMDYNRYLWYRLTWPFSQTIIDHHQPRQSVVCLIILTSSSSRQKVHVCLLVVVEHQLTDKNRHNIDLLTFPIEISGELLFITILFIG